MQFANVCFVLALTMTFAAAYPHTYTDLVKRIKRQSQNISDSERRGTLSLSGGHQRSTDSFGRSQATGHIRADGTYNLFRSQNGNSGLYGTANYQRNFGDTPVREQYGVGLEYRYNNRGRIGVRAGQQTGSDSIGHWRTNNIAADANYDFYRSRNGNTRLSGNAYYQRSSGDFPSRSDYGGGVVLSHRFRRNPIILN